MNEKIPGKIITSRADRAQLDSIEKRLEKREVLPDWDIEFLETYSKTNQLPQTLLALLAARGISLTLENTENAAGNEAVPVRIESIADLPLQVLDSAPLDDLVAKGGYATVDFGKYENEYKSALARDTAPAGAITVSILDARSVSGNPDINHREVLGQVEKQGWRPATLRELLSFGIAYPEGGQYTCDAIAYLWGYGSDDEKQRGIGSHELMNELGAQWHFLAIKK